MKNILTITNRSLVDGKVRNLKRTENFNCDFAEAKRIVEDKYISKLHNPKTTVAENIFAKWEESIEYSKGNWVYVKYVLENDDDLFNKEDAK